MFFTTVNPMDDDQSMEEIVGFFGQAKDRSIQKYLETLSEHSVLVQIQRSPRREECTTLITMLLAASAATAKPAHSTFTSGRKSGRMFIEKVVHGKDCKTECVIVRFAHPLEIEVCETTVLCGSRVHSALKPPHIRGASSV